MRMTPVTSLTLLAFALAATTLAATTPAARANGPAVDYETVLDTFFSPETGTMRFGTDYVVAFAPEGEVKAEVAVLGPDKKVRGRFPFFPEPRLRSAVFARMAVQGPAEVQLTEPGDHNVIFLIDGKPVTRMAFLLKVERSGDAFDPRKTYAIDGPWRTLAHLTMRTVAGGASAPQLNFWVGGLDLAPDAKKDMYHVSLLRGGTEVAHGRRSQGLITPGHFKRTQSDLFHPHDEKESNARPFVVADWLVDGDHELRVTRASDGATIRAFTFKVAGGKFEPHPRAALSYDPHLDHLTPRVQRKHTNQFEMTEAIWIEGKRVEGLN